MIFRSEPMESYDIRIPHESAWYVISEIGNCGRVNLIDQHEGETSSSRPLAEDLGHLEKSADNLYFIEKICLKFGLVLSLCNEPESFYKILTKRLQTREQEEKKSKHIFSTEIQEIIQNKFEVISEQLQNYNKILLEQEKTIAYYNVLKNVKYVLFKEKYGEENEKLKNKKIQNLKNIQMSLLGGLLKNNDVGRLQKIVFRLSRGNTFLHVSDFAKENTSSIFNKKTCFSEFESFYFLAFQTNNEGASLKTKLSKVIDTISSLSFEIPNTEEHFEEAIKSLELTALESENIICQTKLRLIEELGYFSETISESRVSRIEELRLILAKEKAIIDALNKFKLGNGIYHNYFWISKKSSSSLVNKLNALKRDSEYIKVDVMPVSLVKNKMVPPTLIQTNDLTSPFQEIVNTYGIPRYLEINPALFTIVTFPFEFGVMFGDIGHGGILLAIGVALIYFYNSLKKTFLKPLLQLRFLIFLMGLFACFCGFIYNDFLSIPWNLFGSCYERKENHFHRKHNTCTYWFGIDPLWYQASNEVSFQNSLKMKLSIIIGVVHMILGISLKITNSIFFKNYLDLFFEAIPQLLFFFFTFGYMAFAIVLKWLKSWDDPSNAPSIIGLFINMGITLPKQQLYGDIEGKTQTNFQQHMFVLAGVCALLMFLPKPIILSIKSARSKKVNSEHLGEKLIHEEKNLDNNHEDAEIGEIFVHQFIEVIEFILGSISNTASYLRLWALSLAHSQLAKVFFEMTILNPLKGGSPIISMIGLPVWVCASLAVLMIMDLIECFLHTLRLHWVEFQNKFFKGDGYLFSEFNIHSIVKEEILKHRERISRL